MVVSSRTVAALGLGLLGVSYLASSTSAQQPPAGSPRQDAAVIKTASQAPPRPPRRPRHLTPAIFGTVDIRAVLKDYEKVKTQQEEFKSAAMAKHNELMKIQSEGQDLAQRLAKMTPNSVDAKKCEDRITQLKAQLEAGRESAQRDFAMREADMLATLYKEVQEMVSAIAQYKKMTYVVQVSKDQIAGSNPDSVMAAMSQTFVYADPTTDITKDVIYNLNKRYKAAGGVVPKAAASAPAACRPGR